jgi:peptidoglycan hydrolase-like protein with peptidoglycan-binding domain
MLCMPLLARARNRLGITAALVLAVLALPPNASASAHGPAVAHAAIVRVGDGYARPGGSGSVRWAQRRLRALGYHAGPTDGLFGPLTEAAVTRFQREHRLAADGVVGPITAHRLRAARSVVERGAGYRARHGSQRVRTIQKRLRALGYGPGPVDGRFGPRTERAVTRFQADHRLVADGVVGPRTAQRLLPHAAPPAATHVDDRTAVGPPGMPAARSLALRPLHHAKLPHGPPIEAVLIAPAAVGLAAFTASYVRTRARIAQAARGQRTMSTVNGDAGRAR